MVACRINILGDSSSSGIGSGHACYPAKLFRILQSKFPLEVLNCAVPGCTSADASRFFHAELAQDSPDYLIIYLGNNEGAVGDPKGYYSGFKVAITEGIYGRPNRRFNPILSPVRFRFEYNIPAQSVAMSPVQFGANLRSIIRSATKRSAKVIVINPVANRLFPCGLGARNSSYFCYLDDLGLLGDAPNNNPTDSASELLAAGLLQFARGNYAQAALVWEPVASEKNVAGFIAKHNLACAAARLGHEASIARLKALLGEYERYDSTILYNLAHVMRWRDKQGEADRLLALAVEKDVSVYRIRQDYRDVIAGCSTMRNVNILDLSEILESYDFVDYCHPTDEGHEKIAQRLAEFICPHVGHDEPLARSFYEVRLPSPDYARAPRQTLCDYYCIDWPIPQARIVAALSAMSSLPDDVAKETGDEIEKCVRNFYQANADHPVFAKNIQFVNTWIPRSHEILSCPENYIYRLLYNYGLRFEAEGMSRYLIKASALEEIRFSSADYERMILRANNDSLNTELDVRDEYFEAIIAKTIEHLLSLDHIYRVLVGARVRTLMTWYTREALRYGTQSRMSMLYPRWDIEKLVEGLVVGVVIAVTRGRNREVEWLDERLSLVLQLLEVHEHHVRLYHRGSSGFSAAEYQRELDGVRRHIGASVVAAPTR